MRYVPDYSSKHYRAELHVSGSFEGEIDGVSYYFISEEDFLNRIKKIQLLILMKKVQINKIFERVHNIQTGYAYSFKKR